MATSSVVKTSPDTCIITCPRCAQVSTIETAHLRASPEALSVRCGCGCVLRLVRMDQRRHPRKPVQLSGTLLDAITDTPLTTMTIIDLSMGGIRFATHLSNLRVGDSYRIAFRLDDAVQTEIREEIVIRIIHTDRTFGAEFIDPECQDQLDFYLTPWALQL